MAGVRAAGLYFGLDQYNNQLFRNNETKIMVNPILTSIYLEIEIVMVRKKEANRKDFETNLMNLILFVSFSDFDDKISYDGNAKS